MQISQMKTNTRHTDIKFYTEEDARLFNNSINEMRRLTSELLELCDNEVTESEKEELQLILNENKRNNR